MSKRSRTDYESENPPQPWKQIGRSYDKIDKSDLEILLSLATKDLDSFVKKNPKYKQLKSQVIAVCLCQGGALHYNDGTTGIRDFDVYTFFSDNTSIRYPVRRRSVMDFGIPKFSKTYPSPKERNNKPDFVGRNCDIMGRQIPLKKDYIESIQSYLTEQKSPTAYHLAHKAVVVLWPKADMGKTIWNRGIV
jgi:hypothetical protein